MQRSADWMEQAERDLDHAGYSARGGHFEWACFAAQQAAEKAIKAVFQKHGAEARGHSVDELLLALSASSPIDEQLRDGARELDKAYLPARYPDALPAGSPSRSFTRAEAQRMIEHADRILRFCQGLLA